jgi:glycosyltransferase involved in cell wall biosynthesis
MGTEGEIMASKYSVVIPCYNERENIPVILERFEKALSGQDVDAEVILVDNGSSDGSAAVIGGLLPKYPFAKTARVEVNQGYGYGILCGLKAATGDYIGWTHADMQTDPADVVEAFRLAEGSSAPVYIKGRRKGRSVFDVFFTFGMSCFETLILGKPLFDINAQPNIFPRYFFEGWKHPPNDFSLDLYAYYMALKSGLAMKRFPVRFPTRIHGESHWNTGLASKWTFIKRTVDFSFKLKKST